MKKIVKLAAPLFFALSVAAFAQDNKPADSSNMPAQTEPAKPAKKGKKGAKGVKGAKKGAKKGKKGAKKGGEEAPKTDEAPKAQ